MKEAGVREEDDREYVHQTSHVRQQQNLRPVCVCVWVWGGVGCGCVGVWVCVTVNELTMFYAVKHIDIIIL